MPVSFINPHTQASLRRDGERFVDEAGNAFPIVNSVPRFCEAANYTESFGKQWNWFDTTQLDRADNSISQSSERFFKETGWTAESLAGLDVLEVGSGAGRFTGVVLAETEARLWSVDYSNAVEANARNHATYLGGRLQLAQASIYDMPFADGSFDRVFCLGVLQHTPDFRASVKALVAKAKPGGEIAVDFYPIKNVFTKIHAKYLLRPFTKRMSHERLLRIIRANAGWMIKAWFLLDRLKLRPLTRFIPICDIQGTLPAGLSKAELREWVVLDTFDMFSPAYDNPQRLETVAEMFRDAGAEVRFAGFVPLSRGAAAVVRAIRR